MGYIALFWSEPGLLRVSEHPDEEAAVGYAEAHFAARREPGEFELESS